jgi:hypothetical protein
VGGGLHTGELLFELTVDKAVTQIVACHLLIDAIAAIADRSAD